MLEAYQAYGDYRTMMDLTERLIIVACDRSYRRQISAPGASEIIDFTPPLAAAHIRRPVPEHTGVAIDDPEGVKKLALGHRLHRRAASIPT
jgi:lysyl-tRNA synthetase, class II